MLRVLLKIFTREEKRFFNTGDSDESLNANTEGERASGRYLVPSLFQMCDSKQLVDE